MKFQIVLLCLIAFATCNTNADSFDFPGVIKVKDHSEIIKLTTDSEITYFAYYYLESSQNSHNGAKILKELSAKLNFLAKIIMINCDFEGFSKRNICVKPATDENDTFPRMVLLIPPKMKVNPYTKEVYPYTEKAYKENRVNHGSIYNFITSSVQDYSINLTNDNIDSFLKNVDMNKLILFTDKDKTPLLYRGLSSYFYDRLQLGIVKKNEKDITNRFQIRGYPTLLLINCVEGSVIFSDSTVDLYSGDINAESIVESVEFLALSEKKYLTDRRLENGESLTLKNYGIIYLDNNNFGYYLSRFSDKPAFFISSKNDEFGIDILKLSRETSGFINFYYFDCDSDHSKSLIEKIKIIKCNEKGLTLYYLNPVEKKSQEVEKYIEENMTEVKDTEYRYLGEFIANKFKGEVVDITSADFFSTIKEIKKTGKLPAVYLHEEVSF